MGTYIIHFDDKPWEDLDDEQYYRCKEIPWFSTTKTTISRLTPYTEDSAYAHGYTEAESKYREIRDELEKQAYQQGYEQGYKDGYNEPGKGKIQVGDEVIRHYKSEFAEGDDAPSIFLSEEDGYFRCIAFNGRSIMIAEYPKNQYRKTGRHFPEIAEVLQKMKES